MGLILLLGVGFGGMVLLGGLLERLFPDDEPPSWFRRIF